MIRNGKCPPGEPKMPSRLGDIGDRLDAANEGDASPHAGEVAWLAAFNRGPLLPARGTSSDIAIKTMLKLDMDN